MSKRWTDGFNGPTSGEFSGFARPLTPGLTPSPDDPWFPNIHEFALTFDGYAAFDNLGDLANAVRDGWGEDGRLPSDLSELRGCLFFEQRRYRHFDGEPVGEDLVYVQALVEAIRRHTV